MSASNAQVQQWSNDKSRPRSEQIRALVISCTLDRATIDDVYNNVNAQSPTWIDVRPDNPAHLLTPADILAINAVTEAIKNIANMSEYAVVLKACVRSIQG